MLLVTWASLAIGFEAGSADLGSRLRLPVAAAVRPATVPDDHFAVRFSGALLTRPGQWSAPLVAGAGYGLTDNFEIGTALLRFTLAEAESGVPGADGLTAPTIYGAARLPLGPVELGGRAELELPLEGFRALSAGTFVRFHFGSVARVDLSAEATLFYDGVEVSWPSVGDLGATFNLLERWALTGGLSFRSDDLGADLRAVPRVGTLVTLGQPSSPPLLDLEVALLFPAAALTGPDFEEGWGGSLILTLFFDDPADGVGPDPF